MLAARQRNNRRTWREVQKSARRMDRCLNRRLGGMPKHQYGCEPMMVCRTKVVKAASIQ